MVWSASVVRIRERLVKSMGFVLLGCVLERYINGFLESVNDIAILRHNGCALSVFHLTKCFVLVGKVFYNHSNFHKYIFLFLFYPIYIVVYIGTVCLFHFLIASVSPVPFYFLTKNINLIMHVSNIQCFT